MLKDIKQGIIKCHEDYAKNNIDYLQKRGISQNIIDRHKCGYDPRHYWGKDDNGNVIYLPAIIFPTSEEYYVARCLTDDYKKYGNDKVRRPYQVTPVMLNEEIIGKSSRPIFVVEGEVDAFSIEEVGGEAVVALGGTAAWQTFVKKAIEAEAEYKLRTPYLLCLDNDNAGQEATGKMLAALEAAGIQAADVSHVLLFNTDLGKILKDVNDQLLQDKDFLRQEVQHVSNNFRGVFEVEQELARLAIEQSSAGNNLQKFLDVIKSNIDTPCVPTGFKNLDKALDGGLYEGLIILGAESSTGKTALALQIADHIARKGNDVYYFTLEMSKEELMARTISRYTYLIAKNGGNVTDAKSSRDILDGRRHVGYVDEDGVKHAGYTAKQQAIFEKAVTEYGKFANRIYFIEGEDAGGSAVSIEYIEGKAEYHKSKTGRRPIIFIDYLQILAPADVQASDVANMDTNIHKLKTLSRKLKTPIVAISSLTRESRKNDNGVVSMTSARGSGLIEYTADTFLAYEFLAAGRKKQLEEGRTVTLPFEKDEAMNKEVREMRLRVVKNRSYEVEIGVALSYRAKYNCFGEAVNGIYRSRDLAAASFDEVAGRTPVTRF